MAAGPRVLLLICLCDLPRTVRCRIRDGRAYLEDRPSTWMCAIARTRKIRASAASGIVEYVPVIGHAIAIAIAGVDGEDGEGRGSDGLQDLARGRRAPVRD